MEGADYAFNAMDLNMNFDANAFAPHQQQSFAKPAEGNTDSGFFFGDEGIDTTASSFSQSFDAMNAGLYSAPDSGLAMPQHLTMDNTLGDASAWTTAQLTPPMNDFSTLPANSFGSYQSFHTNKRPLQLDTQDLPRSKRHESAEFAAKFASPFLTTPSMTTGSWSMDSQTTPSSSVDVGLSDEAADVCLTWFSKYAVLPSDRHIESLSHLTGEPAPAIRHWFGQMLKQGMVGHDSAYKSQTSFSQPDLSFGDVTSQAPTASDATCNHETTNTEPVLRGGRKGCKPTSKPELLSRDPGKIYQCTRKCGKRYGRKCDWKRNEEEGYPSKSWVCSLCIAQGAEKVKPCFRKYHFSQHFRNIHPGINSADYEETSTVQSDTSFPRKCGFCSCRFKSRQHRIDHIADHFKKGKCMLDWVDREDDDDGSDNTDDDDDDDSPDSNDFQGNGGSSSGPPDRGPKRYPGPQQDGSGNGGDPGPFGGFSQYGQFSQFQLSNDNDDSGSQSSGNNQCIKPSSDQAFIHRKEREQHTTDDDQQCETSNEQHSIPRQPRDNEAKRDDTKALARDAVAGALTVNNGEQSAFGLKSAQIVHSIGAAGAGIGSRFAEPPDLEDHEQDVACDSKPASLSTDLHQRDLEVPLSPLLEARAGHTEHGPGYGGAHMLAGSNERPGICSESTHYHLTKKPTQQYSKNRHILNQVNDTGISGFRSDPEMPTETSLNVLIFFKRLLKLLTAIQKTVQGSNASNENKQAEKEITFADAQRLSSDVLGRGLSSHSAQEVNSLVQLVVSACALLSECDQSLKEEGILDSLPLVLQQMFQHGVRSHENLAIAEDKLDSCKATCTDAVASDKEDVSMDHQLPLASCKVEGTKSDDRVDTADFVYRPPQALKGLWRTPDQTTNIEQPTHINAALIDALALDRSAGSMARMAVFAARKTLDIAGSVAHDTSVATAQQKISTLIEDLHLNDYLKSQSFMSVKLLGTGGFSTVDEVVHRETKLRVGRKTLKNREQSAMEELKKEVQVLQKLRHPHIIRFLGAYTKGDRVSILLSPVAETTLSVWLEKCHLERPAGLLATVVKMAGCLSSSLRYLHEQRPVVKHMDIKPQNILVMQGDYDIPHVVLSDFGISSSSESSPTESTKPLTRQYCAPEVPQGIAREQAADIWSLGCVFLEMLSTALNQDNPQWLDFRTEFSGREGKFYWENVPNLHEWLTGFLDQASTPNEATALRTVKSMLNEEPADRPSASMLTMIFTPAPCCLSWPNEKVSYPGPLEELEMVEMFVREDGVDCLTELHVCGTHTQKERLEPFARAHKWLQECIHDHESCRRQWSGTKPLPTRLVDLQPTSPDDSSVRVINTNELDTSSDQINYAALSHVWGDSDFQLTLDRLSDTHGGLPREKLPSALSDAFAAATRVGYRYVWVDSLCVLQDSLEDKRRECTAMASIFRNAGLTIVSSTPADTIDNVKTKIQDWHSPGFAWDTRAWGLQERLLSHRLLHLAGEQLYWECNALKASETFPAGMPALYWEYIHSVSAAAERGRTPLHAKMLRDCQWVKREGDAVGDPMAAQMQVRVPQKRHAPPDGRHTGMRRSSKMACKAGLGEGSTAHSEFRFEFEVAPPGAEGWDAAKRQGFRQMGIVKKEENCRDDADAKDRDGGMT